MDALPAGGIMGATGRGALDFFFAEKVLNLNPENPFLDFFRSAPVRALFT